MFTGIIKEVGRLERGRPSGGGRELVVAAPAAAAQLAPGDSVAVNGVCLTATAVGRGYFVVFAGAETCRRTTLGALPAGAAVNLEPALRAGQPLGGHLVQGHVDGVGWLADQRRAGETIWLRVQAPPELLAEMVERGSVAVDGISLTITALDSYGFTVAVVPFTWQHTNLSTLTIGTAVNIETDLIAKYVRRFLQAQPGSQGLTKEFLAEHGYL